MNIYTGGTFDLYHFGHANLLRWCRKLAGDGQVIVSLNTDEFIRKYKGKPPVMTYDERRLALESCKYVDLVIPNTGGSDSKIAIQNLIEDSIRPDLVVIGSDWHDRDYLKQMGFTWDWLRKRSIGICYVPYTKEVSSTDIKSRMCKQ